MITGSHSIAVQRRWEMVLAGRVMWGGGLTGVNSGTTIHQQTGHLPMLVQDGEV